MEARTIGVIFFIIDLAIVSMLAWGADGTACLGIVIIISGLVIAGVQTGPATGMTGIRSGVNTAVISKTIVDADSKTRWRRKTYEEYRLAIILIVSGLMVFIISALIAYLAQ